MPFAYEVRAEQRCRIWLRKIRLFKKTDGLERSGASIEDERKQLAALDELRLRRERRLEEYRRSQPDAIDPLGPSSPSASASASASPSMSARSNTDQRSEQPSDQPSDNGGETAPGR